jgi:hypothetical protein
LIKHGHQLIFRFRNSPRKSDIISGSRTKYMTTRGRKTVVNIATLLMSTIGPNTKNARMEPVVKVFTKANAKKASTVEQTDSTKANISIAATDTKAPLPIDNSADWGIRVCIPAANKHPTTKYLPISKNSSPAITSDRVKR